MAKLFPPLVDGIIPAFYSENGAVRITVPFSLNRAVSKTAVKGIELKIKTVQSSSYLGTIQQTNSLYFNLDDSPYVIFYLDDSNDSEELINRLRVGQFYKFQIAFIDDKGEIGYYSSVGISKYTSLPSLSINNFDKGVINNHIYEYTGIYQQDEDKTEKVYSYIFNIYDNLNTLVASSGTLIHNSQDDVDNNTSYDKFIYASDLPLDTTYRIQYSITTTNGLIISSPKYKIAQKTTLEPNLNADMKVFTNFENGYIGIELINHINEFNEALLTTGAFLLSRASSDSNFTEWMEISRFKFIKQKANGVLWIDYTGEQGKQYQYSIQQYNDNGLYSNRILSEIVYLDFEDLFLSDGKKQLKIRYNPKITSFKVDVLEQKTDTIGSQYPYIMRNGKVYYKEFPISGLISYFLDSDNLFVDKSDIAYTTNLTSENIYQERNFKMVVYEWLTNGELKLFRSPVEGNYFVRLMNVSMTPNDTVGRMLHTFSGTAYEIAEFNYENLSKYGFVNPDEPREATLHWRSIDLFETNESGQYIYSFGEQINSHSMYTLRISDALPGDKFVLVYNDGRTEEIEIGATGSYYIDLGVSINGIFMSEGSSHSGSLTYSYYLVSENKFDKISNITVSEVPCQQFIGEHDIITEITCVKNKQGKWVRNPKVDIVSFLNISAQRRTIGKLVKREDKYYYDRECKNEFKPEEADPFALYSIGEYVIDQNSIESDETAYVSPYRPYYRFKHSYYYDFYNSKEYYDDFKPALKFKDEEISVEETRDFNFNSPGTCDELYGYNGIVADVSYQLRTIDYSIEDEIHNGIDLISYKQKYNEVNQELKDLLESNNLDYFENNMATEEYIEEIQKARKKVEAAYNNFILKLIEAQEIDEQLGV